MVRWESWLLLFSLQNTKLPLMGGWRQGLVVTHMGNAFERFCPYFSEPCHLFINRYEKLNKRNILKKSLIPLFFMLIIFCIRSCFVELEGILGYVLDWTSSVWIPSWSAPMKITWRKQFLQNNKKFWNKCEFDHRITHRRSGGHFEDIGNEGPWL